MEACGVGCADPYSCYDPYYYYVPDYLDYTYFYDGDIGWWYPYYYVNGSPTIATTAESILPTAGVDELKELKKNLSAFNAQVVKAMMPLSLLRKRGASARRRDTQEYGPADLPVNKPVATFHLTVKRLQDQRYGWRLTVKPVGADDSMYKAVLAGSMENAVEPHSGTGLAGFDFDALHAVDPVEYPATGQLITAVSAGAKGLRARVSRLINFRADEKSSPTSAVYAADRTADNAHHIRWGHQAELVMGMPDQGPEQVIDYLTWIPTAGGRLYTVLANDTSAPAMQQGDLPPNTYFLGQSCYGKDTSLLYKAWHSCAGSLPTACLDTPPVLVETPAKSATDCAPDIMSAPPSTALPSTEPTPTAPVQPPALPDQVPLDIPQS